MRTQNKKNSILDNPNIILDEVKECTIFWNKTNKKKNQEYYSIGNLKAIVEGKETEDNLTSKMVSNGNGTYTYVEATKTTDKGIEVYNIGKVPHKNWFIIDLETGGRGWYPGCIMEANTLQEVKLKADKSDGATDLATIPASTPVELLILDDYWNMCKYNSKIGYIRVQYFSEITYHDPV